MSTRTYNETPSEKVERLRRAVQRAHGSIEFAAQMKDRLPELRSELAAAVEVAKANPTPRSHKKMSHARRFDEPSTTPPMKGFKLVAKRQFNSGGKSFNAGCEVKPEDLGANFDKLLSSHYVGWVPGSTTISAQPKTLPPAALPLSNPAFEIIECDGDRVQSWKVTYATTIEKCAGNAARARDLLMADRAGAALYKDAVRIECARVAKLRGVPSVPPNDVGLL